MTPDQFALLNRSSAPWLTLWLIVDFESGRGHAVGSMAGGTWKHGEESGQYETTGKGIAGWTYALGREKPVVTVTWTEVGRWVKSLPAQTRDRAAALQKQGTLLQREYPSPYPGIGRPYAWDMPESTEEERERDRAALAEANAKRFEEVTAWHGRKREHDTEVAAFLDALKPPAEPTEHEPADLLELLAATLKDTP